MNEITVTIGKRYDKTSKPHFQKYNDVLFVSAEHFHAFEDNLGVYLIVEKETSEANKLAFEYANQTYKLKMFILKLVLENINPEIFLEVMKKKYDHRYNIGVSDGKYFLQEELKNLLNLNTEI